MSRHGKPQAGALAAPNARSSAASEEERVEKERKKRRSALTANYPKTWQKRVRALLNAGFNPTEVLEESWAALHMSREHYVGVYANDCELAEAQRQRAADMRDEAEEMDPGPERAQLLTLAARMEQAAPDHARAAQTIVGLVDAERKCQDSLAIHRPSGHQRVHIEIVGQPAERDPGDNYVRFSSSFSESLSETEDEL